jgi:tetratricopeptide (TPR) repeat protein
MMPRHSGLKIGCALMLCLRSVGLIAQNVPDVPHQIAALEQQVQNYLQEQKPQLAIPVLRHLVSLDPKNVNAHANLGVLLFFQANYPEAIPQLRAALELQRDLWRIEALLGIAEKRMGDPKQAQLDLDRAFLNLDDRKIQIQAGLELIELDGASSQPEKAMAVAAKLLQLAPQDPRILFAAFQVSRQMMDQSLLTVMMVAPDSAEMHMMLAGEFGRQGDQANAIVQLREAVRLNPKLPGAHFALAEELRTSTDPALNAQAKAEYEAAIQVNPYDQLSLRQLGGIMAAKGDFKAAEADYKKALALQPKDSDAKTGLAIVLISLNRPNEAISLLQSALEDDPTNIVAHYRLSGLYRRAGQTADAGREMELFHHYKDVKEKLGKAYRQSGAQTGPL